MGRHPEITPEHFAATQGPELLERDAELETIDRLLGAAAAGRGSLLLVEGAAGMGKTLLLSAARERAAALGFAVLRARGSELEREFSYGVVRQLFEPAVARLPAAERAELLSGAAALAAPLLDPASAPDVETDASFGTLHGLYWLTATLAERQPVLLAIDDLQWCDRCSLRFAAYLTRRLDGVAALLAAGLRTGEEQEDETAIAELEADPAATLLVPAPLSRDAVRRYLREAFGGEIGAEFREAVYSACGGNPLLLAELVRAMAADDIAPTAEGLGRVRELGVETVTRSVLRRLRRLSPSAPALARAVAVLGDDAELELAAALAGLELEEASLAASALARIEILRPRGALAFTHPAIRAAVYESVPGAERRHMHRRAASLLAAAGAPSEQVAAQLMLLPPAHDPIVTATLLDAARGAAAEGAAEAVVSYLRRALAEPPPSEQRLDVLLLLGRSELVAGGSGAHEHLVEAHALALGGPRAAETAVALAQLYQASGRYADAIAMLEETIERLPSGDEDRLGLEAELIAQGRFRPETYPIARARLERLGAVGTGTYAGRYLTALRASDLARECRTADEVRALALAALEGDVLLRPDSFLPHLVALQALVHSEEFEAAEAGFERWLDLARRTGSSLHYMFASGFRANLLVLLGELVDAEADARALAEALPQHELVRQLGYVWASAAFALLERGDLDGAERLLACCDLAGDPPHDYQSLYVLDVRSRIQLARGDADAALAGWLEAGRRAAPLGMRNPSHCPWRSQAAVLVAARGETAKARRLAAEELEIAREWGRPRTLGVALRAAGLAEGGDAGLSLLCESVDVLAGSRARLEHARSLVELGAALRRANRRAEARQLLGEALELAHRLGAAPLVERARDELVATGARPRRIVRSGVESLTPSELRVARMAAQGQTNREIAQALFVTQKTVETHLSNVFRKLEIASRAQLPGALAP